MESGMVERMDRIGNMLGQHGADLIQALLILVIGLVALHWLMKQLRVLLDKIFANRAAAATVLGSVYILLLTFIVATLLVQLGMDSRNILKIVVIVSLIAITAIILLRPYIPTLPFKVGNVVKVGDLLGKIEATTLVHTRMRTFDGKTVFIPNEKILRDFVINYQVTPTRRIKIDIPIRHIKDILKTKQLIETIMVEDPRVLKKPARPVVYTLNLVDGCVMLGGRCWVKNAKFWVSQCELLEKILLAIEREGIALAFRRKAIRLFHETPLHLDGMGPEEMAGPQDENETTSRAYEPLMTSVPTEDFES